MFTEATVSRQSSVVPTLVSMSLLLKGIMV